MRISLKWFLLGSAAIAILIGMGKRYYDDRQWLAAPVVAGSRESFSDRQLHQWLARQNEIREALRGSNIRWDGYVTGVWLNPTTDRSRLSVLSEATELVAFGGEVPLRDEDLLWAKNHPNLRRLRFTEGKGITNHSLAIIGTCPKLEQLMIESSSITDDGLVHLSRLDRLEHIDLFRSPVTGRGLASLARLPRLSQLRLKGCPIDDEGLEAIGQLRQLEVVDLSRWKIDGVGRYVGLEKTHITDAGLMHLENLERLREINLGESAVTEVGVRRLASALPNATINYGDRSVGPQPK